MTKFIEISEEDYKYLVDRESMLTALEEVGVDGWDGYDEAMTLYRQKDQDDESQEYIDDDDGDDSNLWDAKKVESDTYSDDSEYDYYD